MTTTRNPFLDDEDIFLLGGDGDRGDGNGKRPPHPNPPSTNNYIANTMTPPNNPFDDDDLSLLSGDGNRDGLPQQVRGPSISSHVSKVAATNDDAGRTTGQRRWSEQPRPTQDRGRPLYAMQPGRSLASLLPKKNGGGGTAASASAAAPMTRSRSNGRQRSRLKLRLPHLSSGDDVSVTDSICSGVIREFANAKALAKATRSKIESKIANIENKIASNGGGGDGVGVATATKTAAAVAVARSHVNSSPPARSHVNNTSMAPLDDRPTDRGEVLDVVFDIVYARFDTNISSCSDSSREDHHEIMRDIVGEDGHDDHADDVDEARLRREQRKERVMERLEKYREDHSRLRAACSALESALEMTSQKLREVDKGAASRIRALELELRDAREGGEATRTNQEACIKELGKKLIRQAHVIKRQRDAVEQLKMQLEAMAEEMAMQDERDSRREEDLRRLEEQLENSRDNQAQMQAMLQENIEGMVELKSEVERDAKNIMELEFDLGQKEALLNRVARDLAEKTVRICELEQGLEDKIFEMESMTKELDESKESAEVMRQQFDAAAKQLDESRESVGVMQQQLEAAMKQLHERKESAELVRQQLEAATKEGEDMKFEFSRFGTTKTDGETVGDVAANAQSPRSLKRPSLAMGDVINKMDKPPLVQGRDGEDEDNEIGMKEAFASELQAKDATIRTLDDACKEMEATINAQRSEMVKMSSTYREDSYLKRKEIAELTKQKAAYALKLRALEKAFQCVSATGNITTVSTSSHSTHGGGGGMGAASLDNKSVHQESHGGKEGKAAAVSARLGGFRLWGDSKVVKEANFFDDDAVSDSPALSDRGSISGGKGEDPEEC